MTTEHLLVVRDEQGERFWTGERWSPDRAHAKDHGSWDAADRARAELDTDLDVLILVARCEDVPGVRA